MLEHETGQRFEDVRIEAVACRPLCVPQIIARKMEAILVIHVDDLLALTATKEAVKTFVVKLRSAFKIKDLGEAPYYMGCHITRDRAKKELSFYQHLYARTITERFKTDKTAGHGPSDGRCKTAVEGARPEKTEGEGRNDEYPLARSSGGTYVDIGDDMP